MARLRWWHITFFAWLFALYNIERLHEPINLASFVYVVAAGLALLIILLPGLQRIRIPWLLLPVAGLVVVPKLLLGQSIAGAALPLTVTELVAVGLTAVLARQLSVCLEEYRSAAVSALVSRFQDHSRPFESGQKEIYREVRRARACHRPLALLVVKASDQLSSEATDRVTRELQQETLQHYLQLRIADLLAAELHDHDIITCRDRHFVAVLPECDRDRAALIVDKLERAAKEKTGLDLDIGLSVFPEEITFGQLLERAELAITPPPASHSPNGHAFKPELENGRGAHDSQGASGDKKARQLNGGRQKVIPGAQR